MLWYNDYLCMDSRQTHSHTSLVILSWWRVPAFICPWLFLCKSPHILSEVIILTLADSVSSKYHFYFCSAWGPPFRAQYSHSQPARPYSQAQGSPVSKYSTNREWGQHRDMNTSQFLTAGHHNKHPGTKQGRFRWTDFEAFDPFALTCRCLNEHISFQWDAIMQKPNLGQLPCV